MKQYCVKELCRIDGEKVDTNERSITNETNA